MLTDKILACWLIAIGIHLLSYSFKMQGYWGKYPHLIGVTAPFPFLHGPFLYLYVTYSLKNENRVGKLDYLHFIPVIISYLYLSPFYFTFSALEKTQVDNGTIEDYSQFSNFLILGFVLSGFSYVIVSYRKLQIRKKLINENFSYDEEINMDWLRYSILSIAAVFFFVAVVFALEGVFDFRFGFNADMLFYTIIVAFVVYLGYSGIKQRGIFLSGISNDQQLTSNPDGKEYQKSGLKGNVAVAKHKELLELMKSEKPYLNSKLTLNDLAQKLSLSSNHLSQIINQYEDVNFRDFVNKYRVDEFIERAQSGHNFSFLAIALDSGFNSKSSFNTVFKKFKEKTPSQYMAENRS